MFAVIRRKLASRGSSSALVFRNSVRPALSTARACNNAQGEEVLSLPRRLSSARYICHLINSGRSTFILRPTREVVGSLQPFNIQTSRMKFSSDCDLVDAVVPFMGESISDGTLATFLKQPGDKVVVDEPIAQVETDKVSFRGGNPVKLKFLIRVLPLRFFTFHQVTIDVASPEAGVIQKVPMTRLRKRVASRLKDSQNTFALLTTFNEVDMTNLMELRSDYKDAFFEKHGVKLGFMSGFVKAAVSGLQNQPVINAVINGDEIIYRDYVDISIAVGTPKGLVVPVVRNADKMNFAEIEKEINNLAKKATAGSLSMDEMAGGSFTISNGGVYGSLLSTPIINPPQSAILGMHSIVKRPMVVGGKIVARPMMYIALTYDHRLIDGREAVYFLRRIKDVVEDPRRLLLDI